ncbi:MAG: outer membrane protein assembly factor BamA [Planctomycetes bacterium]|nr:outer membrane protein assembly factor BamA [Planctomycetota bacterium]
MQLEHRNGVLAQRFIWPGKALLLIAIMFYAFAGFAVAQDEAPIVQDIKVVGNILTNTEDILYRMRTRVGKPLDRKVLDEDHKRLFEMGSFSDLQFHQEEVEGGIRLQVRVKEKAVIRRILIRGNSQVSTSQLNKQITCKVGELFDPGRANTDVRAIEKWYQDEQYYLANIRFLTEPFEDGVRLIYEIEERGRVHVKDVVFHGNNSITKQELLKHMETTPTTFFNRGRYDRKAFERDLERLRLLYQSRGFLDAVVTEAPFQTTSEEGKTRWQQQAFYVHINIEEGPIYRLGRVSFEITPLGEQPLHPEDKLRSLVESMPGQPYSPISTKEDEVRIRDFYGENGRSFTDVKSKRLLAEEGTVVDLVFQIKEREPVIVDQVQITGLNRVQERVVRREIEVFPGTAFNSQAMRETIKNINRLNFFEQLDPSSREYVKQSSDPNRVNVIIDVEEVKTSQLSAGVGLSSADGVVGSFGLKMRNFDRTDHPTSLRDLLTGQAYTGAGEYFAVNVAGGSRNKNLGVDFLNPWIFDRPVRFGMGGYFTEREWSSHDENRTGAYFLLGRKIFGKHWDISGKYEIQNVDINNLDSDVSDVLRAEEGDNWISKGSIKLAYDTRDSIFTPSEGWYASATQELAGGPFGGTKDFWRSRAEANYFYTLWKDKSKRPHVLALRSDVGTADAYGDDSEVPFYERYYAGGIGSLRGFDYHSVSPQDSAGDPIGGEAIATASVEYIFPLFANVVRGAIFYDIGSVGKDFDDWGNDWRHSCGAGVHLTTPLGPYPIVIYYTHPISTEEGDDTATVQFNIGAYF